MIHDRIKKKYWAITFVGSCLLVSLFGSPASSSIAGNPVRRESTDRDGDLIVEMIREGMLDAASTICTAKLADADHRSDAFARWTIRQSKILVARQLSTDDFNDEITRTTRQPINDLLGQYPDHPRALFLRATMLEIDATAARHDVVVAAVQASGSRREQRALRRITTLSRTASELATEINTIRSIYESQNAKSGSIVDLIRLQQEIQVLLVSMQVLQTDLFAPDSRDYIATATAAVSAADEAIMSLPPDCSARHEIERIRVQAILRSGDHRRARSQLDSLPHLDVSSPIVRALQAQIDLASGQHELAKKRLEEFYGATPMQAPKSIEIDLARLKYLIAVESNEVGSWLDAIGQRSGAYARRRAESVSLQGLRSGQSNSAVNPSLVAAQGQDWMRRGEPQRAAELLSAAAAAEVDHNQALQYAREAAAAFVSIQRGRDAGDLLAKLSIAKREADSAAQLQLQAAFLFATTDPSNGPTSEVADRVEKALRSTIEFWPDSESADKAKTWLVKIFQSQKRLVEAAEIAMPGKSMPGKSISGQSTETQQRDRLRLWTNAIHSATFEARSEVGHRLVQSFEPLLNDPNGIKQFRDAVVLLLDRDQLASVASSQRDVTNPRDEFLDGLLRFRISRAMSPELRQPPGDLVEEATWRLMQDARQDPQLRMATARLIEDWNTNAADSFGHAIQLAWLDDVPSSVTMLRRIIAQSETPGIDLRRAAELLSDTDNAEAKAIAMTMWDELASGLTKGNAPWHTAKLESIELLSVMNQKEEAGRRAKYILLTSPPLDNAIRQRYKQYAR